jgi:deoxyadenosine/deoxycytidine kinase
MPGFAFQKQLFFLLKRWRQMQSLAQPSVFGGAVVSDFMFAKDAIFARLNLSDEEHRLYQQLVRQLAWQVREPDLVIWLQAPTSTLIERIRRRGIAMEQDIGPAYLERLAEGYAAHFHAYDGAPVFAVATDQFNPAERAADLALLIERLAAFKGRREFLNLHGEPALS